MATPVGRAESGGTGPDGAAELLRALPLFSRVDPDHVRDLATRTRVRRIPRGAVLFHQSATPTGFFIVVDGLIKLSALAFDGGEKVVEVMHPGNSFGEAVMFLGEPYPVTATALAATRLLAVPVDAVDRLLGLDAGFARRMLAGLSVRLHTMVRDVQSYALQSSRERVVSHLLRRPRTAHPGGGQMVGLGTSKQVLASRLSLTPETLSRVLRELSAEGLIQMFGRRIVLLDIPTLAAQGRSPSGK